MLKFPVPNPDSEQEPNYEKQPHSPRRHIQDVKVSPRRRPLRRGHSHESGIVLKCRIGYGSSTQTSTSHSAPVSPRVVTTTCESAKSTEEVTEKTLLVLKDPPKRRKDKETEKETPGEDDKIILDLTPFGVVDLMDHKSSRSSSPRKFNNTVYKR